MDQELPPEISRLGGLVRILLITMILGIATIIALIAYAVTRNPAPVLPDTILLPAGETPLAVTHGAAWSGVVTTGAAGEHLHVLDPETGEILRSIDLDP